MLYLLVLSIFLQKKQFFASNLNSEGVDILVRSLQPMKSRKGYLVT